MTETERYLKEYWYAKRSIGRLMLELAVAKNAYKESYAQAGLTSDYTRIKAKKERSRLSPVEYSALLVVDQYRAEMESIEKRIESERRRMDIIECIVNQAGLEPREKEYIRLRYFENRSTEAVSQRMYCSISTVGRIRARALKKIESSGGVAWQEA